MPHTTNAQKIEEPEEASNREVLARFTAPRVVIAGPEKLTIKETRAIKYALEDRKARVTVLRMTDEFRMQEFIDAVDGCTWVLIAVEENPGREIDLLRIVERAALPRPKLGIICLGKQVHGAARLHANGHLDLVVKRTPGDMSFHASSRTSSMLLAQSLSDEADTASIARCIVPNTIG